MIELIQQYGLAYLFTDGNGFSGVAMTLWLFIISVVLGFFLSIPLAIARVSEHFWVRWPVEVYTYLFRGTPLYIQLLICYTGLYGLEVVQDDALLNQFFRNALNCTLLAFVLNTCAYTVEIFAGAIRNIPHGEIEAAKAYGLHGWRLNLFVVVPAALRRALPAYSNEMILMLHATSLAFTATIAATVPSALAYTGTSWRAASTTVTGTGPALRSCPSWPAPAAAASPLGLPPPSMRTPMKPTTSTATTSSTIFQKRDIQLTPEAGGGQGPNGWCKAYPSPGSFHA